MLLKLFVLSTFALVSSQPAFTPSDFLQPVFNPASLGSPTTPPPQVVETLGPSTGKSCLARFGPVCTFTDPDCCSVRGYPFFIPGLAYQVPCREAKRRYNSMLSTAFTKKQCLSTKIEIEANAGLLCECQPAPTPAPKPLVSDHESFCIGQMLWTMRMLPSELICVTYLTHRAHV